jgi:hypothetical protein
MPFVRRLTLRWERHIRREPIPDPLVARLGSSPVASRIARPLPGPGQQWDRERRGRGDRQQRAQRDSPRAAAHRQDITDVGARLLADSPHLKALEVLTLEQNPIFARAAKALCAAFPDVRYLNVPRISKAKRP